MKPAIQLKQARQYDEVFFDDMLDLFSGLNGGHVGKYIYDDSNWNKIVQESKDYYIPRADKDLVESARADLQDLLPQGLPYIDYGVGGVASIQQHVLPIMRQLGSKEYCGIDFCQKLLRQIEGLTEEFAPAGIKTLNMDFFANSYPPVSDRPALGVMNGLTLSNMYGTLRDNDVQGSLARVIKNLSRLAGKGWLLLTIDTNQDETLLKKAYVTPLNAKLYLNVFSRMATQLPNSGFDPAGFIYEPEWHPKLHLFAHCARVTQDQSFSLGDYQFEIKAGQKFHLLNSYKFSQTFFESCCAKANQAIVKVWHHETPMKLYLLKATA